MTKERLLLLGLWLLIGLLIGGVTYFHPTHATSPDSVHYLNIATDWRMYDGTFPPGYPALIALVSTLTSLPVLWVSKVVNWLALGLLAWLWCNRIGAKWAAGLLALWLLPGNLRIAAYSWSETVFIVLLLETVWGVASLERSRAGALRQAGLLVALVWLRYVGLFLYVFLVVRWVSRCLKSGTGLEGEQADRTITGWAIVFATIGIGSLLGVNLFLTGHSVGGPRLLPTESWPELVQLACRAVMNELLIYNIQPGFRPAVFWLALAGQLLVVVGLIWFLGQRLRRVVATQATPLVRWFAGVGAFYFLTLFCLRIISPFDPLTERLMAPGSICWQVALVLWFQSQHSIMSKSPERAEMRTNPS